MDFAINSTCRIHLTFILIMFVSIGEKILPQRVLPVYRPGDTVRGTLILDTSHPIDAKKLTLACTGTTLFRISGFREEHSHIDDETIIWEKGDILFLFNIFNTY